MPYGVTMAGALGARVINNSHLTSEQTSGLIIREVRKRLAGRQ